MTTRDKIGSAYPLINWAELNRQYFAFKTPSFNRKMNGSEHHGKPAEFTADELGTLQSALKDIAVKIYSAAENLDK